MSPSSLDARIDALVLAAGGATRMGRPKQLLPLAGIPLVRRAVEAALGSRCRRVRVVVGAHAREVAGAVVASGVEIVENPDWRDGLASSIAAGMRATVASDPPEGVLVVLADQPSVTALVLDGLLDAFADAPAAIAACAFSDALGPPAVFGAAHFEALASLGGDRGARALLESHRDGVRVVPFEGAARDIDTPEDYAALLAEEGSDSNRSESNRSYSKK